MCESNSDHLPLHLHPIRLAALLPSPLVSVLLISYNHAAYIADAIESVLGQSYSHVELVICDDGSTDVSRSIIARYQQRDPRIRLITQPNAGEVAATSAACAAATGEIMCFLDSDDLFVRDKLAKVVSAFRANPAAGCCTHLLQPISKEGRAVSAPMPAVLESGWIASDVVRRGLSISAPGTSGLSFRREVIDRILPFPTLFSQIFAKKVAPADSYMIGAASLITPVATIREPLSKYRIHDKNGHTEMGTSVSATRRQILYIEAVFHALVTFAERYYGLDLTEHTGLEHNPSFCENTLALYILTRKSETGMDSYRARELFANITPSRRKRIWQLTLILPLPAATALLRVWWGFTPWKRLARPLWRVLRGG